jgi:hypothetical protein
LLIITIKVIWCIIKTNAIENMQFHNAGMILEDVEKSSGTEEAQLDFFFSSHTFFLIFFLFNLLTRLIKWHYVTLKFMSFYFLFINCFPKSVFNFKISSTDFRFINRFSFHKQISVFTEQIYYTYSALSTISVFKDRICFKCVLR